MPTTISTVDIVWEPYAEPLSFVVVETAENSVLFGGGVASMADSLTEIVEEREIDAVVIEHADVDHFEAVPHITGRLDVEIAVPRADEDLLEEKAPEIQPDVLLEGGERYWGIEAIHVPGHTPGNMAFLIDEVLIASDTVIGTDSTFVAKEKWSGILGVIDSAYNADDRQTRNSVEKLLDFEYTTVLTSHGANVIRGGGSAIETVIDDLN